MKIGELIGNPINFLGDNFPKDKLPTNGDVLRHLSSIKALSTDRTNSVWYNSCADQLEELYKRRGIQDIVLHKQITM